jgi:acetyl-CoA synthetase
MRIEKKLQLRHAAPSLSDYEEECASFSWEAAREELDGLPGGRGLNIAYEAIGRHVAKGHGDQTAIIWLGKSGGRVEITYADLDSLTNRFANVLAALGVAAGDRVYSLAGRIPELYVCGLGTLKHQAVFCPLFSAFGPEPIAERLNFVRCFRRSAPSRSQNGSTSGRLECCLRPSGSTSAGLRASATGFQRSST